MITRVTIASITVKARARRRRNIKGFIEGYCECCRETSNYVLGLWGNLKIF
jgi:hypothetical protein